MNFNCSTLLGMINLQEQVKKTLCYCKLFWPFTVWINYSSNLKNFANSRPPTSNFKNFCRSPGQFIPNGKNFLISENFSYKNVSFLLISSCAIVEKINSDGQSDTMYGTSRRDQASIHDGPFAACWWSGFFLPLWEQIY